MKIRSFRVRILVSFLGIVFFTVLILALLSNSYAKKRDQADHMIHFLEQVYINILKNYKIQDDFFSYEMNNQAFFETGESHYLKTYHHNLSQIIKDLSSFEASAAEQNYQLTDNMPNKIRYHLNTHDSLFSIITEKIHMRGYKDWGTVGQMRAYVHKLENFKGIDQTLVLSLRRHEKDYIIRNDPKYVNKLHKVANQLNRLISQSNFYSQLQKDTLLKILFAYENSFDELVALENHIGLNNNSGLVKELEMASEKLDESFSRLIKNTQEQRVLLFKKYRSFFIIMVVAVILTSIILIMIMSRKITKPVIQLSSYLETFVAQKFKSKEAFPIIKNQDEIGKLSGSIEILIRALFDHIDHVQSIVEERTEKILKQKEEIEAQKEEIKAQRDDLAIKHQIIEEQKHTFEQHNMEILDSIRYSKYIQDALLPDKQSLKKNFDDYFVFYKPKDIIGGDFYWHYRIKNKHYDLTLLAVADCTGHGVPGALMSMLGIAFLNEIVERKSVKNTALVLDALRKNVIEHLKQDQETYSSNDGMDIALVAIDHKKKVLQYAGANRPVYHIRDKTLTVLRGDNMPIGKCIFCTGAFINNQIPLKKNDAIYLFSDGFIHQFGGKSKIKYNNKRFRELLLEVHDKPFREQGKIIEKTFYDWKGDNVQIDDVLVFGFGYNGS